MRSNKETDSNKKKKTIIPRKPIYLLILILMMLVGIGFLVMLTVVDAFPPNIVMGIVVIMIFLLIITVVLFSREIKGLRIVGIIVAVVFILFYGIGIYYLANTYSMFSRISSNDETREESPVDVTEDSYNIYITGIDQWSTEKGMDLERSDVNIVVTVCPKTRKILLTSIPRDAYVPLNRTGQMDKLTHTGIYGVDETIKTVEKWLDIDISYYVKMNFTACVKVIDAMGGIDVYSPYEFEPIKLPGWTVKKGWNHMNGNEALAFARERKFFNGEDAKRVINQQRVVKAILRKMTSSSALLTHYVDIVNAASDNMSTNMSNADMSALVKMQLADLGSWEIATQKIKGYYDTDYVASLTQSQKFSVYKVKDKDVKAVKDNIFAVMNPTSKEITKATTERQKKSILNFIKNKSNE